MRIFRLALILAMMLIGLVSLAKYDAPARADCSMADYHPDYTTAMKERCRGLRGAK